MCIIFRACVQVWTETPRSETSSGEEAFSDSAPDSLESLPHGLDDGPKVGRLLQRPMSAAVPRYLFVPMFLVQFDDLESSPAC